MSGGRHWEQDKEATVYIGNLDERVTDSLVWELMIQAGRIVNVHLPKDRVTQSHQGYGFVEFTSEDDAEYAAKIMNQVRLFGKPIRVNKASADKQKTVEIGAELFVGNLDALVTEQTLFDTFSRFGGLLTVPKIAREDSNLSKGYGFVSFSNFESSDEAIANLNGQYLMNKQISVQYAYKKDGKGERHGDQAERTLAAEAKKHFVQPSRSPASAQVFSSSAPQRTTAQPENGSFRGQIQNSITGSGLPHPQGVTPSSGFSISLSNQTQRTGFSPHALPAPPSGLPARPPPSQVPPVYGSQPNSLPPGFTNAPYSSFATPGPPGLPPGFQAGQGMRNH